MQLYDITRMPAPISEDTARSLGYKRVFNINNDIFFGEQKRASITSNVNAAGNSNVIGIIADSTTGKAQIARVVDKEKLLIFNINKLISVPEKHMPAEISKTSKVILEAKRAHARITISSFAEDAEHLLSSRQLIACAMLLGLSELEAKHALATIGEVLHDT